MAQPLQVTDLDGFTASDAALRRAGAGKAEVILARAGLLLAGDRALLEGIYMNGLSLKAVARASGASPRRVVRQANRLVERVTGRAFEFVVRHRQEWTPTRREVATRCFILGLSLKETARELGLSFHGTRRHRDAVLALIDAHASVGGAA